MPRLSVILATYNRADVLPMTLDHLARQDIGADAFEVIIIDDASPDATPDIVRQLSDKLPFQTTFLRNERNAGAGRTQNRGIEIARAPLLLIMADDILLQPGALRAHLEIHERNPAEEVSVLGNVLPCPQIAQRSVFLKHFDPFRYEELWGDLDELPFYVWGAANVTLKTEFMRKTGMFLDMKGRAGAHCHHDVEMAWRLHRQGMRVLFSKYAAGYHHHYYTLASAAAKWRDRGLNWEEFRQYMEDPEFTVSSHLFNRRTYREYLAVLSRPNTLTGKEKYLAWHLLRETVRKGVFNLVTINLFWRPFFEMAERSSMLARFVRPPMYRGFLHYYWNKAVVDAPELYKA